MSKKKKVLLVVGSIWGLLILGVTVYGIKMYQDIKNTGKEMHELIDDGYSNGQKSDPNIQKGKPFTVLLLGLDTGDFGREEQGRSDTMMVVTVNPKTSQTTIVSLARDTYTELIDTGMMDKLNHAYAYGGLNMSKKTVEALLDTPMNHYVSINMKGLKDLIEAIDGIDIKNTLDFEQDKHHFAKGKIHLDGESALAYARMRYEDPNGDYGRQQRQRKIVKGIVNKVLRVSTINNYPTILKAIEKNMKTDLSWKDMVSVSKDYQPAFQHIKQDQLLGEEMVLDGISYQEIAPEELERVQSLLQNQLTNKKETDKK